MSEYGELSSLPEDPRYWDALEQRVLAGLGERAAPPLPWWAPLAARAWTLGGIAAAAAIGCVLLVPPRREPPSIVSVGLLQLRGDAALLAQAAPPAVFSMPVREEP